MKSHKSDLIHAMSVVVMLCCIATYTTTTAFADDLPAIDGIPAACRKAKEFFRPLTKSDLDNAKRELLEAVARLDSRLRAADENGANWRKYVQLDKLQQELERPTPDSAVLNNVYRKLAAGHEGLGLVWFIDVRQALLCYLQIAGGVDNPKLQADFNELMDGLADRLQTYASKPTEEDAMAIGRGLAWLESTQQAPEVVRTIRHYYVQPNLLVEVSADVVGAGIAGAVDDTRLVRDCILGTDISGTGHTTGVTACQLCPDPRRAVIDTLLLVTTVAHTVGSNGPVEIYSNSVTRIGACKRSWFDVDGMSAHPSVAQAVSEATICDIRSIKGRHMVENIAWRRAGKQKGEAQWIASRHAEDRVNRQVDQQGGDMLGRANEAFVEKFRKPLQETKQFPQELNCSTTSDALHLVSLRADAGQLAAPSSAPAATQGADLTVWVHQSMINNVANSALAGMTVHEASFQATMVRLLGELPPQLKRDEDEEPWAISFARNQPIEVTFADDGFAVVVRGDRYYRGKDSTPGLIVTAVYKIAPTAQGFKAVRQGEISFTAAGRATLTASEIVVQTLLKQRFEKIFEPELLGEGFVLPGKWQKAGKMRPTQMVAKDGWLTVAWKRTPAESATAASR